MTVIMCPSNDDNHGDFPHRLVIPFITLCQRDEDSKSKTVTVMGPEYVICAHCDHWIARAVPMCDCREDCHQKPGKKRYRSVTSGAA